MVTLIGAGFMALTIFMEPPAGLGVKGWHTLGVAVFMGLLWVSESIPFTVTALLPLVLFPAFGISNLNATAAPYASPVIFLFLGGIFLGQGMERSGFHKRFALHVVRMAGLRRSALVAAILASSAFLSMWINNTAVALMMLPIVVSLLSMFQGVCRSESFRPALVLAVAYGATIGGMSTLVGTAPNAIFAGYMLETHGRTVSFLSWLMVALPLALALLALAWLVLAKIAFKVVGAVPGDEQKFLIDNERALGPVGFLSLIHI